MLLGRRDRERNAGVGAAFVNYPHEFDSFHQKVARALLMKIQMNMNMQMCKSGNVKICVNV